MALFNYSKIIEDASAIEIAENIGIKIVQHGKTRFIECPVHEAMTGKADKTLDKCMLTDKGYHCFSCGANGNVIKLVQNFLNVSSYEACKIICQYLGGTHLYLLDEEANPEKEMPFNSKQLEALGLKNSARVYLPTALLSDKEEFQKYCYHEMPGARNENPVWYNNGYISPNDNGGYIVDGQRAYVGCDTATSSLAMLFAEEPAVFFEIIEGKAEEMAEKYKKAIKINIAGKLLCPEAAYFVNTQYKVWLGICERISEDCKKRNVKSVY